MLVPTVLAFVASTFGVAHGLGVAAVHNKCGGDMYLWSVGDVASNTVGPLDKNTIYNETYRVRAAGGIAVKIAGTNTLGDNATQFEYTVDPAGTPNRMVWFDLSNINGNAFPGVDYKLEPSDPTCPVVYCPAGQSECKAVYNAPHDDASTHACSADADLVFTMCPTDKTSPTGDGLTSSDSSSSSTPSSTGPVSVVNTGSGVLGESGPPVAKAAAAAAKVATSSGGDASGASEAIKYLTATFPNTKRDEHAAAHAHSHQHSHQRLRRSRIFRKEEQ